MNKSKLIDHEFIRSALPYSLNQCVIEDRIAGNALHPIFIIRLTLANKHIGSFSFLAYMMILFPDRVRYDIFDAANKLLRAYNGEYVDVPPTSSILVCRSG